MSKRVYVSIDIAVTTAQEDTPVSFRIQLSSATVKALHAKLQQAYLKDDVRLVRRTTVLIDLLVHHVACSAGSWGRTMRRSVPSWAKGGRLAWRRVRRRRVQAPPPTSRRRRRRRPPRHRAAGRGPSGNGRGHRRGYAGPPAVRARGRGSTDSLCSGPCR